MATNTNTAAEISKAIGAAEARDIEISGVFADELRDHLLRILSTYCNFYYDGYSPICLRDRLVGDITISKKGTYVTGPSDSTGIYYNDHELRNDKWVEKICSSIPPKEIEGHLKGLLISFREVVMRQGEVVEMFDTFVDGRMMFDTSDNGLSWNIRFFKDDDDCEGIILKDLGPIGAEDLPFFRCAKFDL